MLDSQKQPRISLHSPAMVHITIVGHVEESWSEQLGLNIDHKTINEDTAVSVLTGEVVDQAALFGVLNGLYGLGFPLLSVQCDP